jgi:membrane protease YdiL (CAAX protease family)
MRSARSLLIYVIGVFLGGALLAPWLYWLVQSVAPQSHLAQTPFHRYLDRCLLIVALIGIWPLLRSLGAKSARDVGLVNPLPQLKPLALGLLLGFGSLATVAIIALAIHARQFNYDLTSAEITKKLLSAAGTAAAVSVLEEILFRGAIFGVLRKTWNVPAALLVSSMIYAIVHFLAKADITGPVTWTSGLQLLPLKFAGFGDLHTVIPGFFNLTLAGILLAVAFQRTGNLYLSIGLHAGWIFWLKSYAVFTSASTAANTWLWGTDKLIDGWLALVVLAITLPVVLRMTAAKKSDSVS